MAEMADNIQPRENNVGLDHHVINTQHQVFVFLVGTLILLIQAKSQATHTSPFDTHYPLTFLFLTASFLYAAASVAEVQLLDAADSSYHRPLKYTRLLGCAISLVALLFILELLILAWIILLLWACFFAKAAYHFRLHFYNCFHIVREFIINKLLENPSPDKVSKYPVSSTA